MEKKLITEMKFMMERLENPRMTYTEYEKKHKLLTEDSEMDPRLYELTSFRDFITTLIKKVNPNLMFDKEKLERMFNDGGKVPGGKENNSITLYSPGFMNKEKNKNTIFKLGNGDLYELTPNSDIDSPVSGKTVVSPTKINKLPSWAESLKGLTEGPTELPPRPSSDRPSRPSPFKAPGMENKGDMDKPSHQEKLPDSFNKFIETNFETLSKPYSDSSEIPKELKNIKYKYLGSSKNYAITEDGNQYNVYSWTKIYDINKLGSFGSEDEAKKSILKNSN